MLEKSCKLTGPWVGLYPLGVRISVNVKPGSSKNLVEETDQGLRVWLRAQPQDGKANWALVCVLAEHYGVAKSEIKILTGHTSKGKLVEVIGGPEGT